MKRSLFAIVCLLLSTLVGLAQFNGCPAGFCSPTAVGGGGAATLTLRANPAVQHPAFGQGTPVVFSSVATGGSGTLKCVTAAVNINGGDDITVVSANGTLTRRANSNSGAQGRFVNIWCGTTTGGTDTITVTDLTGPNGLAWVGIAVYEWTGTGGTGTAQTLAGGFTADPQTTPAITVPSNGNSIVILQADNDNAPTVNTGTQDYDTISGTNAFSIVGAHISTSGSQTPSISGFSFVGTCMAAVPLSP